MFSGSLVAIVTPMRSDGALDLEAWSRLIDFHLAN
ncbi:MAG: 4-hydroxy-tetrahydrodipicolinate synthase, partial [Gammaproteobacteria bacterium]